MVLAILSTSFSPGLTQTAPTLQLERVGDTARLTCRNAGTGEPVWKYEYPTRYEDFYGYDPGPRACPVVDGDRVYIHGVDGMLVCVAAADGKELWKVDTRERYHFHQNFFGASCMPLVEGDLLILAIGGSPKGPRPTDLREAKGNGTAIVAFDKRTGAEKYKGSALLKISPEWKVEFALLLGLERVLAEESPHLASGTELRRHQIDALAGMLTELISRETKHERD